MLEKRVKALANACTFVFLHLFALYGLSATLARGAARPQSELRPPLGSLSAIGEVYVNNAAAPAESFIFAGDLLRSGATGSATFVPIGKGSFEIRPNTEIIFTGEPQYAAELKFGKVVMDSANGATGTNLRAGSSVVLAVAEGEPSSSSIAALSDGSFQVTCVAGSVGVIPLQGGKGVFIRAGQSVGISAQGELSTMSASAVPSAARTGANDAPAAPSASSDSRETAPAARQKHTTRWILIAAGIAGAGVAAAILSANRSTTSSGISSVSATPSSPISSGTVSASPSNPPAPVLPVPSQPAPQPPQPVPPQPQPAPPANNCPNHDDHEHQDKGCKPHVVLGLAFHF